MAMQQRFSFRKFQSRWEKSKDNLAIEVARKAENQFKDNFRLGGFISSYLEKWSPRKKADPGRAILVKSGRLKRGIRSVPGSNFQEIKLANDVSYAAAHNEGLGKMPKRQFMGKSQALDVKIKAAIRRAVQYFFVTKPKQ